MQSNVNTLTNLTNLTNRKRSHITKRSHRAIRIIGRSNPIQLKYPIYGDYYLYLKSIGDYNKLTSNVTQPLNYVLSETINNKYYSDHISFATTITHGFHDHHAITNLPDFIEGLIAAASEAVAVIESNKGKTGGAAIKRRGRAIKIFKQIKSDFNLFLTASRGALSSTMRLRRDLQDNSEDEIKYFETREKTRQYYSKDYPINLNSIEAILNRDIYHALASYKIIRSKLKRFNSIVAQFNSLLERSDEPTIQLNSPSELISLLSNL